jgi:hypothetical protein
LLGNLSCIAILKPSLRRVGSGHATTALRCATATAWIFGGFVLFPVNVSADVTPFKSPSGNIECTIGEDVDVVDLRCVIFNRSGPPAAPQPANCAGPWGHIFVLLDRGPVRMDCGGPGQPNTASGVDVAGYGQRGTWGGDQLPVIGAGP